MYKALIFTLAFNAVSYLHLLVLVTNDRVALACGCGRVMPRGRTLSVQNWVHDGGVRHGTILWRYRVSHRCSVSL